MSIESVLNERAEQSTNRVLRELNKNCAPKGISLTEINGLAGKIKREKLLEQGNMQRIERAAEVAFLEELEKISPEIAKKYRDAKQEGRPGDISKLVLPVNDLEFKINYIESRIGIDFKQDRCFVEEAVKKICIRNEESELKRLEKLHKSFGGNSSFEEYLRFENLVLSEVASILFKRELQRMLISSYGGRRIDFLIYKCLRLTHDNGIPDICDILEDYHTSDLNGNPIVFPGEAEKYQLERIIELEKKVSLGLPDSGTVVLISDFDLLKFGRDSYKRLKHKSQSYLERVSDYLKKVDVQLETDFMAQFSGFDETFKRVLQSIQENTGEYINPKEFQRISEDYFLCFGRTLNNWNKERNLVYTSSSVARNISTGIALEKANQNKVMIVFNSSTVNGERTNLAVKRRIPMLAFAKKG